MRSVAGSVQHVDGQVTDRERVAIMHRQTFIGQIDIARHDIGSTMPTGQLQPTGDVVVVNVGLGDVGEGQAVLGEELVNSVDVPLGIHHKGVDTIMGNVTAITQTGRIEDEHVRG
jgi:hypothetical protein